MRFDLGAVFEQFVNMYAKLPFAQKVAVPIMLIATMGTIYFVTRWAGEADYQVLYSGLKPSDASGVVEYLKSNKIAYKLSNNGGTVEVSPPSVVNDMRLELAASGLPKGGSVGFELFNENALGRTGFVEKIFLIRAIQGELERTISSIEVIKDVRVHITNPKRSVFKSKDVLPTASVLVHLKPGASLTKRQIKGVSNLVASSVERLIPDNVTILDTKGNQLNESLEDEDSAGADLTRLEYQRKIEKGYAKRIESMLSEVLGAGKAVAKVTADLDFNKYEKEEEMYDPAGTVTRSERVVSESLSGEIEGGVPGVMSNLSNDSEILDGSSGNKRNETVRNYEVSRSVSRTVSEVGKISKLSAAVLVDGTYESRPTEEKDEEGNFKEEKIYKPLDELTIKKIENLVKQAIGYDAGRGDEVTVENIRFNDYNGDLKEIFDNSKTERMLSKVGDWAIPTLFILLFFFIIVRPLMKFLFNPTVTEADLTRLLPSGIEELEAELEAERTKLKEIPAGSDLSVDIEELEELLSENSRLVKDNPQQAALLIRYWLNEGRV